MNHPALSLLALAAGCALSVPVAAQQYHWACGSGAWNSACWSTTAGGPPTSGPPPSGAWASLKHSDAGHRTVNLTAGQSASVGFATFDHTGTGSLQFALGGGSFQTTTEQTFGLYGSAGALQSGGTNTVDNTLVLGTHAQASGRYTMTGGTLALGTGRIGFLTIAWEGRGLFEQTGGSVLQSGGTTELGYVGGSSGEYRLGGDALLRTPAMVVGLYGNGRFEQTGGRVEVGAALSLARMGGSSAVWRQDSGTLRAGMLMLGDAGAASYELNGGSATVEGTVTMGWMAGSSGELAIAGNASLTASALDIGGAGQAIVTQRGGSVTLAGALSFASRGGQGRYRMQGGSLTLGSIAGAGGSFEFDAGSLTLTGSSLDRPTVDIGQLLMGGPPDGQAVLALATSQSLKAGTLVVGGSGQAGFLQGVARVDVTDLVIGQAAGGSGTYELNGGSLAVSGRLEMGRSPGSSAEFTLAGDARVTAPALALGGAGQARFTQLGGSVTLTGALSFADAGGQGSYRLSGGSLTLGSIARGSSGSSSLEFDAGSLVLTGSSTTGPTVDVARLVMGGPPDGQAALVLAASQSLKADLLVIGSSGQASFEQQAAKVDAGELRLAELPGSQGTLRVADAQARLATPLLVAGRSGRGTVEHSAGRVEVVDLIVGQFGGSQGRYVQTGGKLVATRLSVAAEPGSQGSFQLSGSAELQTGPLLIGGGVGSFEQSGGTLSATTITLGGAGVGSYALNAGTLQAQSIRGGPISTFSLRGGTLTTNQLAVATFDLGSPTVTPLDFTIGAHRNVTTSLTTVGQVGAVNLLQTAGVHDTQKLLLGATAGSAGRYRLAGGTLRVGELRRGSGSAHFVLDGGTLVFHGSLMQLDRFDIADAAGSSASFTLAAGRTVSVGEQTLGRQGHGSFDLVFGRHEVAGNLWLHNGGYTLEGGALVVGRMLDVGAGGTGRFVQNGGSALIGALTIAAGGGSGEVRLAGGTLQVTGELRNHDRLTLAGGRLQAGLIYNHGRLAGQGEIGGSEALLNFGQLAVEGGALRVDPSVFNLFGGLLSVQGQAASFTRALHNDGRVELRDARVELAGGYAGQGALLNEGSRVRAAGLAVGVDGYLVGDAAARWELAGRFDNHSTQAESWDTTASSLVFSGDGVLLLAGHDAGADRSGYHDNFAWRRLRLHDGVSLVLEEGNTTVSAALYLGVLALDGGLAQLAELRSSYNVYYDAGRDGNAWLQGKVYALAGGGQLLPAAPVPEPGAAALLLLGLITLSGAARRRRLLGRRHRAPGRA